MPQSCSMVAGMEDAQRPCMGMEARHASSQQYYRGVKGLDPDPLWELGLARCTCDNKVIRHTAGVPSPCTQATLLLGWDAGGS